MSNSELPPTNPLSAPLSTTINNQPQESTALHEHIIEHLELLAEKADIQIEKYLTGKLLVKKVIREQTIHIPVVLKEEVLVIEYQEGNLTTNIDDASESLVNAPSITLNGELITLNDKQMIEIPLYREQAVVHKTVVITEKVDIGKLTTQHSVNQSVVLRHEELDVKETKLD